LHPLRGALLIMVVSTFANPVVFASLDHRLHALNPPGSGGHGQTLMT
jgi:hypothetical protein